jgi:hypothetical protein
MLAAQALEREFTIVSIDEAFDRYGAGKDLLRAGSDFDEPLADFAPYTG